MFNKIRKTAIFILSGFLKDLFELGVHFYSTGVVLILETIKDRKYWIGLNTTIEHFNLPIDTWSIGNASY